MRVIFLILIFQNQRNPFKDNNEIVLHRTGDIPLHVDIVHEYTTGETIGVS